MRPPFQSCSLSVHSVPPSGSLPMTRDSSQNSGSTSLVAKHPSGLVFQGQSTKTSLYLIILYDEFFRVISHTEWMPRE